MTKHLNGFGELVVELIKLEAAEYLALETGLEAILRRIQRTARSEIGTYQSEAGPFPGWAPLAEATKEERVRLGYTEDDPLKRTGALEESIEKERKGLEGVVGSTADEMLFLEFGTSKMPPRPVLGPAAFRNKPWLIKLAAAAVVSGFVGRDLISSALDDPAGDYLKG